MPNSKTDTEILMNRINERKNGMKKTAEKSKNFAPYFSAIAGIFSLSAVLMPSFVSLKS